MEHPTVSVIILSWNGKSLLERFLPSVLATEYPNVEIVVADNASSDGTGDWLEEVFPSVRLIRHPENWLFAKGNNRAIAETNSSYICLLNNDVEVEPDWLDPLVEALETNTDVAAVQPKLLQVERRTTFEYAGASGGFLDKVAYPFARGRLFETLEEDTGQYDDPRDVCWASGACILMRRSALEAVGGLDERFEMHMEEIDLCWRFWRNGWRVRVEPASRVYHLGGGSLAQGNPRKTYLNFRNSLLMLYKNTPAARWPETYRMRRRLDKLASLKARLSGNSEEYEAIRSGVRDAEALFHHYANDQVHAKEVPNMPMYGRSIAVDYFFRTIRRFGDLKAGAFAGSDNY